jgi:hypothetical protein
LLKVALSTINQIKSKSNHLQFTFAGVNFRGLAEIAQSRARTHAVLVIGLYEFLGNPAT